eukprot:scaffold2366_cov115-Cylindrotheca_fusiformis.AAC.14
MQKEQQHSRYREEELAVAKAQLAVAKRQLFFAENLKKAVDEMSTKMDDHNLEEYRDKKMELELKIMEEEEGEANARKIQLFRKRLLHYNDAIEELEQRRKRQKLM